MSVSRSGVSAGAASGVAWPNAAPIDVRARAAAGLVGLLDRPNLALDEQVRLEAALTLAADDPAPRVRLTLAEAIASRPNAPVHVIAQLATDRPDIAGLVLARSPVVTQDDLADLVPRLDARVLPVIGARATEPALAALLIEIGDAPSATALLRNPAVVLDWRMLERIADRHGSDPAVRELLLSRPDLPISARYALVDRLCSVLAATGLVQNVLGERRGKAVLSDAQGDALVASAGGRGEAELAYLADEVADRNGIDATMLMRAICHLEPELLVALASRVSGVAPGRVRPILRTGRTNAMRALFERCDATPEVATMLASAVTAVTAARAGGPAEATAVVLEKCRPVCRATGALAVAVRRWHVEALRRGGRGLGRDLANAA